ncbi:hypothetical protein [Sphingomonas montana]|uniref:hypothetical protein n=1 Tax=Sphingomonas montana TaxID=1843236 RepID=UPI0013EC554F|nr:hypothetical protein [Sphingomonas montana]
MDVIAGLLMVRWKRGARRFGSATVPAWSRGGARVDERFGAWVVTGGTASA